MLEKIMSEPLLIMALCCLVCGLFIIFTIFLCAIRKPDKDNCYKNYCEGYFKRNLK